MIRPCGGPPAEPPGYWAEVVARGPVCGTGESARHVLGTFRTLSPVLALRWLRGQARRIADRIDPDPARSEWAGRVVRATARSEPDCPAELRRWAGDVAGERAARERVKGGRPLSVTFADLDCAYTLTVGPVPPGGTAPRAPGTPRNGAPPSRTACPPPTGEGAWA
ncbi:hypothetical protein [Streptomyces sp. SID8352]|uniref:hypothetical protein n=1 Tax=Streptomyces sp. SID8352 TaxID=2690338 RepID=UPI00136B5F42|nr:hypothetical protein [Streptomyces sp. SID8352]MYU21344.1 hypothetical protein [Streptomyces sp. SID8352]